MNSKLRALISNNFGRRNNLVKDRKALETYVSLKGYKPGNNQWSDQNGLTLDEIENRCEKDFQNGKAEKMTLEEIVKQLGTSKTNLTRALRIERNLTDSMEKLLDTEEIIKNRTNIFALSHK